MVIFASSLPSNSGCGNVCVLGGGGAVHMLWEQLIMQMKGQN